MDEPKRTATSNFGVGRRESHDASEFYARFRAPVLSDDVGVVRAPDLGDGCIVGDIRHRDDLPDRSVALVVTSPPYFAGKEYEEALGQGEVPASYGEFLTMLTEVLAVCARKLEPGGRMAVNVANLGRKPYRSLSADVVTILQDRLGLLLRGEVIWQKSAGASGNCAWGSYRSPANPVLRDVTERVVVASKGRFDRARTAAERRLAGLPHVSTLTADEFMSATLDVWQIEPESARRVNHPAPFPVQLPERLIHLYTYEGDVVLDPFLGSGSTLVAAARTGRRGVGYDLDPRYVDIARARLRAEGGGPGGGADGGDGYRAVATTEAKGAPDIARRVLEEAGFRVTGRNVKLRGTGATVRLAAVDGAGAPWWFDVTGAFTTTRGGLARTETVWRTLGRAHVVRNAAERAPFVLLTSHLPRRGSEGDAALRAAGPDAFFDAVEMLSGDGRARLRRYAGGGHHRPLPGFWTERDLAGR